MRRCDAFGMLDHGIDEIVADLGEVVRLPVIAPAERLTSIQHGLVLHERLALDRVGERPREGLERKNRSAPIDVAPGGAAFDANDAAGRIDAHAAPQAHVDHQAAVTERGPPDVVTAAPGRQPPTGLPPGGYPGDGLPAAAPPPPHRRPPRAPR